MSGEINIVLAPWFQWLIVFWLTLTFIEVSLKWYTIWLRWKFKRIEQKNDKLVAQLYALGDYK